MRNIPIDMVADFQRDATTFCRLVKVVCKDGTRLAFTTLDSPLQFDDGVDNLLYSALNGIQPSRFETTGDLSVDNAEMVGWVQPEGITEQQIRAGLFDYARVIVYKVNYLNPAPGRMVIEQAGRCGQTKFSSSSFSVEFRSKTQQLRQPVGDLFSLTCRRVFGDAFCGKPVVWEEGTVTEVDPTQPDRAFTGDIVDEPNGGYALGVVEWLTGSNAGVQMEVETFAAGEVALDLMLPYAVEVGDTFRIRQDCGKTREWCRDVHDNILNMDAEPDTPVADGVAAQIPGGQTSGGTGATTPAEAA